MAEGEALPWRDWLQQSHSTLLDELSTRIDAVVRRAAEDAASIARAEGDLRLAEARDQACQAATEAREIHEQALLAATEQQKQALQAAAEQHEQALQAVTEQHARALEAAAEQHAQARLAAADLLQQSVRRLRQTSGEVQILKLLNELCAPFAPQSVVVVFENNQARAVAVRGLAIDLPSGSDLSFDIAAAPALVTAIESRDPVVALLSTRELSEPLADALGVDPGSRAWLFPVLVRHAVVAMVIAAGALHESNANGAGHESIANGALHALNPANPVSTPNMELLCDVAGLRLEAAQPAPVGLPSLVQIESPLPAKDAATSEPSWDDLSSGEQRIHLQAQRMARVRTAEMRLYQNEALQRGTAAGDLYGELRVPIDAARTEFLQNYLSKSATMVDYLHLEILRTLAHDDDRLLGPDYPGPMV